MSDIVFWSSLVSGAATILVGTSIVTFLRFRHDRDTPTLSYSVHPMTTGVWQLMLEMTSPPNTKWRGEAAIVVKPRGKVGIVSDFALPQVTDDSGQVFRGPAQNQWRSFPAAARLYIGAAHPGSQGSVPVEDERAYETIWLWSAEGLSRDVVLRLTLRAHGIGRRTFTQTIRARLRSDAQLLKHGAGRKL